MNQQAEKPTAIFHSVGQALHVAFLIMSVDAPQDSPLRKALMQMMKDVDLTEDQAEWFEQLRGAASGTVNFSGMSPIDVRAQCALIISAVRSKLPQPEMWAVQAKFGYMEIDGGANNRRYAFSAERIDAIKGLSHWLAPSINGVSSMALDCLVAKAYANHSRTSISLRDLEKSFGIARSTVDRRYKEVQEHLHKLEFKATERLRPIFESQGIVELIENTA